MMTHNKSVMTTAGAVSFLLGQMSIWWGFVIALAYPIGFGVLWAPIAAGHTGLGLPLELPAIGLAVGGLGWLIGRLHRHPFAGYGVAGMVLNAVPLLLAALLRWHGAGW